MYNPLIITVLFSIKLNSSFLVFGCHDNGKAVAMANKQKKRTNIFQFQVETNFCQQALK